MENIITAIGYILFIVAAVVGAVWALFKFVLQKMIEQWMNASIERFKASLKSANDKELERLRNDLTLKALEHEVRFRWLHEAQGQVFATMYEKLFNYYKAVGSYVGPFDAADEPDKSGKLALVQKAQREFSDAFYPKRVYLPRDVFDKVSEFADKLTEICNNFTVGLQGETSKSEKYESTDHWSRAYTAITDEAAPLFAELHDDFQKMLGFRESTR